jgi:hypothetical protein
MVELGISQRLCTKNGTCKASKRNSKAFRQQLYRRGENLFKKALELSILCTGVDIYVLIHHNGRFKSFNSNEEKAWILSQENLVKGS